MRIAILFASFMIVGFAAEQSYCQELQSINYEEVASEFITVSSEQRKIIAVISSMEGWREFKRDYEIPNEHTITNLGSKERIVVIFLDSYRQILIGLSLNKVRKVYYAEFVTGGKQYKMKRVPAGEKRCRLSIFVAEIDDFPIAVRGVIPGFMAEKY
jgi:hypothetical protein